MTQTGKTWMAKREMAPLARQKLKVIVHSGTGDPDWPGCEVHYSADSFEKALNTPENAGAFVVVDEASVLYSEVKRSTHPTTYFLGQTGRHRGFRCYFLTQYPTALQHNIRVNCSEVRCFALGSKKQAKMVCEDWGFPDEYAARIVGLPKLHFFKKEPMQPPVLGALS